MRVECERCHAIVVADFDVDPDGVTVSCRACGGTFRADARRRAAPAGAPDAAAGCVKCGAPLTDEPACPRCGLARERAAAWAAAEPAPPDELIAAWTATEAAWGDAAAHDRLAAAALAHGAMPWLARRYRDVQRARPDDAIARARIDRLGLMSVAALRATASAPPPRPRLRLGYVVLAIVALTLAGILLVARATTSQRRGDRRRPAVPASRLDRPRLPPRAPPPSPTPAPSPTAFEPAAPGR